MHAASNSIIPEYGDLTRLNTTRTILDTLGSELLGEIARDYVSVLDSAVAVYEANGDYALGIISGGWCKLLDTASRDLCGTDDNAAALASGCWLCHESCWTDASKRSITEDGPVDTPCSGGLRIYAVPIRADGEVIGSINFGYGAPPTDPEILADLGTRFHVAVETLTAQAAACKPRDDRVVEEARQRLHLTARLIGALVERQRAEAALARQQNLMTHAERIARVGAWEWNLRTGRFTCSSQWQDVHGTEWQEAPIEDLKSLAHPDDLPAIEAAWRQVVNEHRPYDLKHRIIRADNGATRVVRAHGEIVPGDDGEPLYLRGAAQDITEQEEAAAALRDSRERLARQEHLRALGQMASGIAHDFNNVLTVILGFTDLLLHSPAARSDETTLVHYVELMRDAANTGAATVERMRSFYRARDTRQERPDCRLDRLADDAVGLTRPQWRDQAQARGAGIEVATDLQTVPPIIGSPGELREAIANLILNAVAACQSGGHILVRTEPVAEGVLVTVRDTGCGMDEETRRRCIEPFFTSREASGSGLGLSMVHGTIERHGGSLRIISAPGRGTTVDMILPIGKSEKTPNTAPGGRLSRAEDLSVLIVDDEPAVRHFLRDSLEWNGHRVTIAEDGHAALERFAAGAFDLVITDRAMPGINGDELARRLKEAAPDLPIIMLTGFGSIMDAAGERPDGIDRLLAKPVTLEGLEAAIGSLLA